MSSISSYSKYLTDAAGILGVTVVGGLIPSYVSFAFSDNLVYGIEGATVQSIFDNVLPNILPLSFVFFIFYLFKKKNANTIVMIIAIIIAGIILSFLGWM